MFVFASRFHVQGENGVDAKTEEAILQKVIEMLDLLLPLAQPIDSVVVSQLNKDLTFLVYRRSQAVMRVAVSILGTLATITGNKITVFNLLNQFYSFMLKRGVTADSSITTAGAICHGPALPLP